jgi:FkbM family methyltransferase
MQVTARRVARLVSGGVAGRRSRPAPPADAVSLVTDVGELWLPADCAFVTPALRDDGTWDPEDGAALAAVLEPGFTVLDVGAHVGYFATLAARLVGPAGRVVAIEPDPLNFELLEANIRRLRLRNVEALNAAAWRETGTLELARSKVNSGDHRLASRPSRERVAVRAITVDGLLGEARVDVALLDTQGSERMVLEGMLAIVERWRPRMQVEFWPDAIEDLGGDAAETIAWYRELGYALAVLGDHGIGPDAPASALVDSARRGRGGFRTLLMSPL